MNQKQLEDLFGKIAGAEHAVRKEEDRIGRSTQNTREAKDFLMEALSMIRDALPPDTD